GGRAPSMSLLGLLGGLRLGVLLLELRHSAGGVEHALLAGVERVARTAGLGVDLAVLRGAAGGEGAAAGTGDGRHVVLRVDVRLHAVWSFPQVVAGSPLRLSDVNRYQSCRTSVPCRRGR